MPKVRLSGKVDGSQDPTREERARLLYLLFAGIMQMVIPERA